MQFLRRVPGQRRPSGAAATPDELPVPIMSLGGLPPVPAAEFLLAQPASSRAAVTAAITAVPVRAAFLDADVPSMVIPPGRTQVSCRGFDVTKPTTVPPGYRLPLRPECWADGGWSRRVLVASGRSCGVWHRPERYAVREASVFRVARGERSTWWAGSGRPSQ